MKVAIVTGASSGIGAATAKVLSRRGWRVGINYSRSSANAAKVAAECEEAFAIQGDVSRDADCRKVAAEVLARWGRIDALVNNAGMTKQVKHADLDGLSAADFGDIFGLNVVGPFQMVRACAQALKQSQGAIVNVSSVAALKGTGSSVAYAASKSALNTMTASLARALAPEVRVNAVCPGYVRTPWQEAQGKEIADERERRFAAAAPLGRAVQPEDVADAILWLIEGARCTTGETILVDAGINLASAR
jgi:3-oxoacyl-[acyl-carrier protein] reductase